jgi:hypothetical protein
MVEYPENDFTRMIEMTKDENRSGVRRNVGVASAIPMPTVQSAAVGRPVEELPPLTEEERAELDRAAIAAGVRDPRLGNQNTDGTPIDEAPPAYGSLEEAIRAGAPVGSDAPAVDPVTEYGRLNPDRMTAREFLGRRAAQPMREQVRVLTGAPRVPNFMKVEGLDLVNNCAVVDGMTFPISEEQANKLKSLVIEVARAAIMKELDEAMTLFSERLFQPAPAEGTDEAVQPVREGEGTL